MYIDIMAHPDWVLKHKKKGTLIMTRDDRYYLYMYPATGIGRRKDPSSGLMNTLRGSPLAV